MSHPAYRIVLGVCIVANLIAVAAAQVTFTDSTFATGPAPTNVVSGDFNRDGFPDLAITDQEANTVTILLGVGGGQFAFGAQISTGLGPTKIVAGDFNGDGNLDLAVALSDMVAILLGNGDGTFSQGVSIAMDGNPVGLAAADFNHDGIPDLAVLEMSQFGSSRLKIFRANGDGTFTGTQTIGLPGVSVMPGLLLSDDFNIDGLPDLAVTTDTTVMVFIGSPNGLFSLRSVVTPPNTANIVDLAAGRLTRGAAPDLVVRVFDNVNDTNFPNSEYVFLNTGFGTFFLRSRIPAGFFGGSVYVADVNGDGLADVISVGGSVNNAGINIALGHGNGSFDPVVAVPDVDLIGNRGGLVARDLGLDSRHDLAVAGISPLGGNEPATHVLLNQNAQTNCIPPSSASLAVRICSPGPNAGVRTTFTVSASGNSPAGVKRMELWVDGIKRGQNFSDQLRATIRVSRGRHLVTVVGVDLYDTLVKQPFVVHAF